MLSLFTDDLVWEETYPYFIFGDSASVQGVNIPGFKVVERWRALWDPELDTNECHLLIAGVDHSETGGCFPCQKPWIPQVQAAYKFQPSRNCQMAAEKTGGVRTKSSSDNVMHTKGDDSPLAQLNSASSLGNILGPRKKALLWILWRTFKAGRKLVNWWAGRSYGQRR